MVLGMKESVQLDGNRTAFSVKRISGAIKVSILSILFKSMTFQVKQQVTQLFGRMPEPLYVGAGPLGALPYIFLFLTEECSWLESGCFSACQR
jgi:hypothetical protein